MYSPCCAVPMYCLAALLQAEEGHIYRKFTWGNRKSLWELPLAAGTPVRERLLEYYRCVAAHSVDGLL
jgi:secreted Zn-dependent insulinase-like peptidase